MGMFDDIRCKYQLPDLDPGEEWLQTTTFQTKDLDSTMDNYTITEDGKLIYHPTRLEVIPEDERNESELGWTPLFNSVALDEVVLNDIHQDIHFYTSGQMINASDRNGTTNSNPEAVLQWYQFRARFTNGTLTSIIRERDTNGVKSALMD